MSAIQFKRHKKARQTLASLFEKAGAVSVIHYSCESFYDRTDGSSPRITSIAMRKLDTGQTISISIHQQAELSSIPSRDIAVRYNELERKMLDTFAERLGRDTDRIWVTGICEMKTTAFKLLNTATEYLEANPISFLTRIKWTFLAC